jgi:hypothetical protein
MVTITLIFLIYLLNVVAQATGPKILDFLFSRFMKNKEISDIRRIERNKRRLDRYEALYDKLESR